MREPCNRGALRNAHRGFGFIDETAGVTPEDSVTRYPLYSVIFHEMLTKAIPGKPPKQAPRMPVALISALFSDGLVELAVHASVRMVHGTSKLGTATILRPSGDPS